MNAMDWFISGWGRFGVGGDLPRLEQGAPVLCLGGPLHGKHMPYHRLDMRAPIPPKTNYWAVEASALPPADASYAVASYRRRRWIGNVMAVPLELYVLDGMTEADTRMQLGELGYSFGKLSKGAA